ncbi:hypothetical protein C2E23DRAFT_523918 [Lenzites betulinus]|nr:hypothetical protein C2E23DRAFT_523918 [Lenzites betulinus]
MLSSFPSPILSVAADVVRDLDGEDTLCSLWALFTKCKESLKDGRRLENISWRLWYREMASAQSSPASSPGSLSPSLSDRRSPSPITPISEDGLTAQQSNLCRPPLTPTSDIAQAHSWHGIPPAPTHLSGARRLSTISTVSAPMERHKSHSSIGVGKMILDILPRKVDVDAEKKLSRSPAMPSIVQPRPMVASVPKMHLLSSAPGQSLGTSFPNVVVIVPTPHPTPPATPGVSHPPSLAATAQTSSHLLPPPPARSLVSASIAPPPASTQPAVPHSTAPSPQQPPAASSSTAKRPSPPAGKAAAKSKAYNEETLKASDRRFFLQDAGSPDMDFPERAPSNASTSATADVKLQSPSSGTSSHIKSEVAGPTATATTTSTTAAKRPRVQVRKSKERHAPVRPVLQRLHSHGSRQQTAQRKAAGGGAPAEPKKAAFNIGSTSSNGSRAGASSSTRALSQNGDASSRTRPLSPAAPAAPAPAPAPAKHSQLPPPLTQAHAKQKQKQAPAQAQAAPTKAVAGPSQPRRGIVVSTSSEYDTTDTENESDWASEADSGEEREKAQKAGKAKAKAQSHAQAAEEARLREAAEEAQRQRDMFAKVPKRSYSNNLNRTRSGLLSQLLNPDPNLFPPNHPYRRTTQSTQDMTLLGRQGPTPRLQMSKSTVAVPLAAQVTAQAEEPPRPASPPPPRPSHARGSSNGPAAPNANANGYRPKGRPQEEELEDTESEDENPDDTIQVSRSLAQQKLAALADPSRRRNSDRGLLTEQQKQHREQQAQFAHMQQHQHQASGQHQGQGQASGLGQGRPSGLTTVASAPIPLNHPYNLPAPAPPMTPRATRRAMLQTELSESLRRNLLWERQVSKVKIASRRGGVLSSGLRPLTAMNGDTTQQQLQQQHGQLGQAAFEGQGSGQGQQGQGAPVQEGEDMEERRRKAMARNRSWADDYHYSGW